MVHSVVYIANLCIASLLSSMAVNRECSL